MYIHVKKIYVFFKRMSYLLLSASPYKSEETPSKKRLSTMRKNIKSKPVAEYNEAIYADNARDGMDVTREAYQNISPPSMDDLQTVNDNRNIRVNELLNKITAQENNEETIKMGNYKPLDHPMLSVKRDLEKASTTGTVGDNDSDVNRPSYLAAMNAMKTGGFSYGGDTLKPQGTGQAPIYSNYNQSYETKLPPYYNAASGGRKDVQIYQPQPRIDDKLMEKINYMIHMLEEQQCERTNNITEEFILYSFLGIFIIYVVDSFARAGKYTR